MIVQVIRVGGWVEYVDSQRPNLLSQVPIWLALIKKNRPRIFFFLNALSFLIEMGTNPIWEF